MAPKKGRPTHRDFSADESRWPKVQKTAKKSSSRGYARPFIPGVHRTEGAYMRSMVPGEKKYKDTAVALFTPATGGGVEDSILHIAQNTTDTGRIGNRIRLRNVNIKFTLLLPVTTTVADGSDTIRIILFIDHQCNGATATVANLLTTPSWESFRNMNQVERFHVIKDKVIDINATAGMRGAGADPVTSSLAPTGKSFRMAWKGDIPIYYSGTDGLIAEIRSENIGIMVISKSGRAGLQWCARVKFQDP